MTFERRLKNIPPHIKAIFCYLSILLTVSGCGQPTKYVIRDNRVYYQSWNEGQGNYEKVLEDASAKDFKEIKTDCNMKIGKDNKHVFVEYSALNNAHAPSFEYIGNYFFRSKYSVYFLGFYNSIDDCEVVGANPRTFRTDKIYPWAYDGQLVIYGHTILDSVDFESFEVINKSKARDRYANYLEGKRIVRNP